MGFNQRAILAAFTRQGKRDGFGAYCAKCGKNVGPTYRPCHVSRVPIQKGGTRKTENCIILCNECFSEIGIDHPEIISWDDLPYYGG